MAIWTERQTRLFQLTDDKSVGITKLVLLYVKLATNQRLGKLRSIYLRRSVAVVTPNLHCDFFHAFWRRCWRFSL